MKAMIFETGIGMIKDVNDKSMDNGMEIPYIRP